MKLIDNLTSSKTTYEPYKYVMQDTGSLYIGAKFSYNELTECEMLPFKMRTVVAQYLLKEQDGETTLESALYYLEKDSFVYKVLEQLKVRVKVQELVKKKSLFGKESSCYSEKKYKLNELVEINLAKKKGAGMVVTEIIISKLALMSFTV